MRDKNEAEIMKMLEIDTWRNLSKDKVLQFAALMPEMDRDVAMRVIAQFPEFRMFAIEALNVIEKDHASTLTSTRTARSKFIKLSSAFGPLLSVNSVEMT